MKDSSNGVIAAAILELSVRAEKAETKLAHATKQADDEVAELRAIIRRIHKGKTSPADRRLIRTIARCEP